jgi:vibriolysin
MVKNGTETGTDCSGGCPSLCPDGEGCLTGADCVNGACSGNLCQAPSCSDSVKNGMEIGPDCGGTCPMCHLVINEVDYDQVGTDNNEYIEIFNGSGSDVSLSGLQLRFVNGSTNTVYLTVDLSPGGTLLNGQYLVVASATVTVPAPAKKITFVAPSNNIQNGAPDGVALVNTNAVQIIDALSYAGSMTMANLGAPFGVVSLVEGTALSALTVDDGLASRSLNRLPNGLDHDNAATDWALSTTLTPGTANVP